MRVKSIKIQRNEEKSQSINETTYFLYEHNDSAIFYTLGTTD